MEWVDPLGLSGGGCLEKKKDVAEKPSISIFAKDKSPKNHGQIFPKNRV